MWTAVILVCTAASFGVMKDGQPQCAYGAPGMVEAHRVPLDSQTVGDCHLKGGNAVRGYKPLAKAQAGLVVTWQCMPPSDAANIK